MDELDKLVDGRLAADQTFQAKLGTLSDEEKVTETAKRRKEIFGEEYAKEKKIAADQRVRAEKAEQERDGYKNDPRLKPAEDADKPLSYAETTALQGAKVHPDFVKNVQAAAKALGKNLIDALKDDIVTAQIERDNEVRESARVVDTGRPRAGADAETEREVLEKARGTNGQREIPAQGTEAADKLFRARRANKFTQLRK